MNPRECVLAALNQRQPDRVPYTLGFEDNYDLLLDKHFGSPDWRKRLIPFIIHVAGVDTDYKEQLGNGRTRDAYGGIWREDRRPWHLEKPPLDAPSLSGYTFPAPEKFFRPDWKEKGIQTVQSNTESFVVADLGWGLFERSWNLRGFENTLMDVIQEPDFFEACLDHLTSLYLQFVDYIADLHADAIMFGDDWGDQRGIIIGPQRWRQFIKPRWAQIYTAVHRHGMYVMHHSCGSIAQIMPDLIEIGIDVIESVQPEAAGMNPYELKKQWGEKISFWGGLGSQSIIPFGTPEQITQEVRRLRSQMGCDGGYILAPAKAIQPETPLANALALLDSFTEE
jgi:uroporphyrinogen decarboxylase